MRLLPAALTYLLIAGVWRFGFNLYSTFSIVFMVTEVGMNPLQLVLVGTVLEATVLLLEIPTGVVADVYSRRLSVIVGMLLMGVGLAFTALFTLIGTVLLAQVIWGAGATFTSGATEAWISDEVGEARVGKLFLRASQVSTATGVLGILGALLLVNIDIRVPIVAGGVVVFLLGVALLVVMPEKHFAPIPATEREGFRDMFRTVGAGLRQVRGNPVLLLLVLQSVVGGMWSEGYDRLWHAHFLTHFTLPGLGTVDDIAWFGVLALLASPLSIAATEVARRRLDISNQRRLAQVLIALHLGLMMALLAFAWALGFGGGVVFFLAMVVFRNMTGPLFAAWRNLNIAAEIRATVLSMTAQMDAIGQVGGGPIIGWIGQRAGLRVALSVAALLIVPSLLLFGRTLRYHPQPDVDAL